MTLSELKKLPIPNYSTDSKSKMINLVDKMLMLNKRLSEVKIGHENTLLQRQIEATDKQIDALVYELYGLTEEEIRIVEEAKA